MSLRILALNSHKGSACPAVTAALAEAFKRLGHEVLETGLGECAGDAAAWDRELERISAFGPDFAFSYAVVRGARFFPDNDFIFAKLGVPYVSFFFDNPFWYFQELGRAHTQVLRGYPGYHIFCSELEYLPMLSREGFMTAEYLPLGADTSVFSPAAGEAAEYGTSFVGSLLGDPEDLRKARRARWSGFPAFSRSIDDLLLFAPDTEAIGRRLVNPMGMPWDVHAVYSRTVCEEAVTLSRINLLLALDVPVHVFGNLRWKDLCGGAAYEGEVAYGADLCRIYRRTRVNLNITSPQLVTAANQRAFDTAACGAFLLTDSRRDSRRIFGNTMGVYKNERDLRDKVRYYLRHETERLQMAAAARDVVMNGHTWEDRAREVIDVLGMAEAERNIYAPV